MQGLVPVRETPQDRQKTFWIIRLGTIQPIEKLFLAA
jgi:hypothetical protein